MNRVDRFVSQARQFPAVPALPAIALAIAMIATIAGPFSTSAMPVGERMAFWFLLMGIEAAKWVLWLRWQVRKPDDYWRAALIGTPLLGLLIPLEVMFCYRVLGRDAPFAMFPILGHASVVGVAILLVMLAVRPPRSKVALDEPDHLTREGLSAQDLLAASAEDHYCRLYLADGSQRLLHARLSDIVDLLEDVDGMRIHRSHWCADRAVVAGQRAGRGWEVVLPCGTALRVSATYRDEARRRGWLGRQRAQQISAG